MRVSMAAIKRRTGIELAERQKTAVRLAVVAKLLVITGGPGVGKTTVIHAILRILAAKGARLLLCAPTGRAARRLSDATGMEAKTIHRLLEVDPKTGGFRRDCEHPLAGDLVVVDETSMVDVPLMHALLKAVPDRARCWSWATSTSSRPWVPGRCWPISSRRKPYRWSVSPRSSGKPRTAAL